MMLQPQFPTGFILTRQQEDSAKGISLTYWLKGADGAYPITIEGQEQVFFVLDHQVDEVRQRLTRVNGWRLEKVALKNLRDEGVHALYSSSLKQARQIIAQLQQAGIIMMEEDIRPADRYLMERFIQGAATPSVIEQGSRLQRAEFHPNFKILSIDLETTLRADHILSAAFYAEDFQYVLMQGKGDSSATLQYVADEKQLLTEFVKVVRQYDPDIFIGWNVVGFDFRVLQKRAEAHCIPLLLGRDQQVMQLYQSAQGKSFVRLAGRIVLDGIDTLKGATYQFESFSLEYVSRTLLQRGKLIDHVDQRGEEIQRLFREDKTALAQYNLEDCRLVWQIFQHADLINYLLQRAKLTGLALDKVGGSAAAFDNQYLPRLHRKGYVAPQFASGASGLDAPGGYVMESRPGLYRNVLVLDFKSLYPSIIRTFKIDPLGMTLGLQPERDEEDLLPGFNHAIFSRSESLLPALIEQLWQARDEAKKSRNQPLSQAIKIIMNSFYGVLGSNVCRFYDQRLSSSITLRGHEILTKTGEVIEQEFGHKVIYGDTDSVFVWLGDHFDTSQAHQQGIKLADYLNRWWQENLQQRFQLESYLEIEYETLFTRFFMPTIRHSEKGSKKRYAGLKQVADGETDLIFKGLENVRTDWTPLARELQEQLYSRIFHDQPWQDLLIERIEKLRAGELDEQLLYRKRIRQPLADYQKNKPPHVQAGLKAERIYQQQQRPSPYRSGSFIEYFITVNGPEPREFYSSPIDYEHYVDKQIRPVAEAIMQFLDVEFDRLTTPQRSLFQ